jgi:hypothetical protein
MFRQGAEKARTVSALFDNFDAVVVIRVWSFGNSGLDSCYLATAHRAISQTPWRADKTYDGYVVRDAND